VHLTVLLLPASGPGVLTGTARSLHGRWGGRALGMIVGEGIDLCGLVVKV
jgi:hypothetical protein